MAGRLGRVALAVVVTMIPVTVYGQSHVRATFARAKSALAIGLDRSATFRSLVDVVDRSNVIVHVVDGSCPDLHARACTGMLARNRDVRYLRITIAQFLPPEAIVPLLAHELQHVATIAGTRDVLDDRQLEAFFRRSGWPVGPHSFESREAVNVSIRVADEMTGGRHGPAAKRPAN